MPGADFAETVSAVALLAQRLGVCVRTERGGGFLNNVILVLNWVFPLECSNILEQTQTGSVQ